MLAKARDELLIQNQESRRKKTIMVTTWHPALKRFSQILCEKHHHHIKNDIYLKKSTPGESNNCIP